MAVAVMVLFVFWYEWIVSRYEHGVWSVQLEGEAVERLIEGRAWVRCVTADGESVVGRLLEFDASGVLVESRYGEQHRMAWADVATLAIVAKR